MWQINWEKRLTGSRVQKCWISVDGTDFRIMEPRPFNTKWFSHRFHGLGVRYEISVCIGRGRNVWANGPYPCGSHSDVIIFRRYLKQALGEKEMVVADRGYTSERCMIPDAVSEHPA